MIALYLFTTVAFAAVAPLVQPLASPEAITPEKNAIAAQDLRTGQMVKIEFDKAPKATVLVFLSTLCPCSQNHEPRFKDIFEEFGKEGFQFVGIHSNRFLPAADAIKHFKEANLPFPVLDDSSLLVANRFDAQATPHAFVLGRNGEILFRGGVDSSHDPFERESDNKIKLKDGQRVLKSKLNSYLVNALRAIQAGSDQFEKGPRVVGCVIDRP